MVTFTAQMASIAIVTAGAARGIDPLDVADPALRHNMGAVRAGVCLALARLTDDRASAVGVSLGFFDDEALALTVLARFRRSAEVRALSSRIFRSLEAGEVAAADLEAVRALRALPVEADLSADSAADDDALVAAYLQTKGATVCPDGVALGLTRLELLTGRDGRAVGNAWRRNARPVSEGARS